MTCTNCNGNKLPFAPNASYGLLVRNNLNVGTLMIAPQINIKSVGAHYFDNANKLKQNKYTLVDLSCALQITPNMEINAYVNNATNKAYRVYAFNGGLDNYAQVAPDRVFAISTTYEW